MTCYHIPDEKTLKILISAFFAHSAVYILYLVYILYPVCGLQSAVCGLQSAFWVKFPHSPILHYAFSFWIEETMIKNNILSLGKQICFTIVWGCAEIFTAFCTNRYPWHQYSHKIPVCELILHFRSLPHKYFFLL